MKKVMLIGIGIMCMATSAMAFDKDAFALHLRKTLSLDTRTEIKVSSDPVQSKFGDLLVTDVMVGGAPYPVYFSKDEKNYFWGFVSDMKVDPDKARVDTINLKNGHSQGLEKAPVVVVEYSDLQCSHCKFAHETIKKELYKSYTADQVRFVFKHFPLSGHDWAETAAVASECGAAQKETAFWEMTNFFFENQDKITKDNVKDKALEKIKELKLNVTSYEKCLADRSVVDRINAQKKEGLAVGVNSTPSLFINGRARRGFRDFDDIKVVIEEKLKEIKK